MVYDDNGNQHPGVGVGVRSFWDRRTNQYPGCSCPPARYSPRCTKPTDPHCPTHGEEN